VGSIEPRKNLPRLLKAYASLPGPLRLRYPLVLAGFRGWADDAMMRRLRSLADFRYAGYVSDQDLAHLYNLASVFVYPSLYEGFGLPPLEAMACGAPVAASRAGSLPEVLGSDAAFFNPHETSEIAQTLKRLLADDRRRRGLSELGRRHAHRFQWGDTAARLLKVFSAVDAHGQQDGG
jgi:glycosyltransferase involved in cell wall biosynthesis